MACRHVNVVTPYKNINITIMVGPLRPQGMQTWESHVLQQYIHQYNGGPLRPQGMQTWECRHTLQKYKHHYNGGPT